MKRAKKIIAILLALVLSISMIPTTSVSAAKKVKLNKTKATIYVGKTVILKLKNNKKKIKWSSSNKKVATVTKKGKVKGKKAGKATITAKVGKKKYKCKITVKKRVVKNTVVQTTQQPTTKPDEQTTTEQTIVIPTEVLGASVVKQDKAEVSFMWSKNTTQVNAGQSYKVYIDEVFYNQYPMPTIITYKFTTVGAHTIRISGVLNGLETTGVTLNVSVTEVEETSENITTVQPSTQEPTTEDLGDSGEDWIVEGSSTKVYIKGYIGTDTDIVIPEKICGKTVIGIKEEAFKNDTNITSVVIPQSISEIEDYIFYGCNNLTSIAIPNSVTSIGREAFDGCNNLTSIIIPDSVTSIGEYAFKWCWNLESIAIPNSVTSIGRGAFLDCTNLESVTIPSSVTNIGSGAFKGTKWIENKKKQNPIVVVNNILVDADACSGNVVIPNDIKIINDGVAMGNKNITSVIISNSVTSIGSDAFSFCINLESVTIPSSVTSIGSGAFVSYNDYGIILPIIIKGEWGSYAELWANQNGHTFIAQ